VRPLSPLASGVHTVLTYSAGGTTAFDPVVQSTVPSRDVFSVDATGAVGVVRLVVETNAPLALAWNPAVSADWDLAASNWVDAATRTTGGRFFESDSVLFDDAGAASNAVNLTTTVRPAAVFVNGTSNYTIGGAGMIADPTFGVAALGKDGAGRLTLATANGFSGGTTVSNGTLAVGNNGALGAGAVTMAGGALAGAGGSITLANVIQVNGAAIELNDGGGLLTLSGALRGAGGVVKRGTNLVTLLPANPNSYAGGTVVEQGVLTLGFADGALNVGTIRGPVTVQTGAVLRVSVSKGIGFGGSSSGNVTVVHLNEALLDYTGNTGGLGGGQPVYLQGSEIRSNGGTNSPTAGGFYRFLTAGTNLTVYTLPSSLPSVMSGRVQLDSTGRFEVAEGAASPDLRIDASITGTNTLMSLLKQGDGRLELSGTNTYAGATLIHTGTLALTGNAQLASRQILVAAAGTFDVAARPGYTLGASQILYGRGTVTGDVAAAAGAQIRPDGLNSVNTLTFKNSLGLNAGSTNGFDLTGTLGVGGGTNDLVVVGGLLEPSNSVIAVNPLQPLASGTYTLFTYAGAKSTTFNTNLTGNTTRKTWTLDEGTPGLVNLVVAGGYTSLVWRPGADANWNLAASSNWYDGATTTVFYNADAVTFDDSGAYSNVVTLAGALLPAAVVVNASSTYVWQGTGKISGTTTVVKAGSGALEVRTTNDYSRGTLVSNGTLAIFQNNVLGAGTVTVSAAGAVALGTAGVTYGSPFAGAGSINANLLGTGTTSLLLTNAASTFVGTINVGPAAAGGGKAALDNGFGVAAAAVNVSNNATLFLRSGSNHVGALRLEGGDTGESLGQLRLELNSVWSGPVTLAGDITTANDGFVGGNTAGGFGFIRGAIGEAGGSRQLSKVGAGTIRLNGTNTYRGGTRITAGVLDVPEISDVGPSGIGTNGTLTFAGGTLRYSGTVDARTARVATNSGAQTIEVTNAVRLTLTGPQAGSGTINKSGVGTLVWASNAVFTTSGYTVGNGTLILDGGSYTSTAAGTGDLIGSAAGGRAVVVVTNDVEYRKTENIWLGWVTGGTGIFRLASGRVTLGGGIRVGAPAGAVGALYQLAGSLAATADSGAGFNSSGTYGYYGLHGGSLSNGNWMQVARLGWGVMRVDGGTWDLTSAANGIVVGNNPGTGVLHIAGGTVRAAGRLGIGWAGTGRGEVTLDGSADVTIGMTGVQFNVSTTATTFGVLNLNGGVLAAANLYKQVTGGYSVVNFNGGTLRALGSQVLLGPGAPAAGALDAAYVRAGGAMIDSSNLTVTIAQNLLAPTGGGVTALPWSGPLAGYVGSPIVAIRGGTGTGATAVALFDHASGTVTGLLVTSPGVGYTIAPTVTLFGGGPAATNLGPATLGANASGGLTKLGAGTLVLAGTNTYTGVTVVATGTLLLNGTHSGGPVSVPTNGTLGGTGTVNAAVTVQAAGLLQPGLAATAGALAVSSVTWSADARFSPLVNGTASVLRVTGVNGLTVPSGAAVARVDVFNVALAVGTYTVIDYAGTIQGGAASNLVLGSYLPRAVMYLTNNTANTSIDLVVVSVGEPIKWVGNVSGQWNINAPTNWATALGGVPTAYLQPGLVGDALVFDDSAVGNFAITLQTNVAPAALVASNELNDYTLGGVRGLGGAAQLRKYGAATFTLAVSNTLSGGAAIYGGTLRLGDGATVGTVGTGPITNNGVLAIDHAATSVLVNALSGTGSLVKAGSGRVTLASVPATNISGTTVNGGTLELINVNASKGSLVINDGGTVEATVIDAINHYSTITVNRGGRLVHAGGNYNQFYNSNLGGTILLMNGGRLEATVPPHATYGNFLLRGNMLVGGTNTSVVAADFRMGDNATRTVTVGETGEDIDLDFQGYVSHFHGNTWGYMTKAGPGTMAFSGPSNLVGIGKLTVNEGRALFLDTMNGGLGNGGLTDNAEVEARIGAGTNQTFVSAINGTGTLIKTGAGSLSLTGLVSGTLNVRVDGGVLEMSALNTYAGSTVISAGTLRVNGRVSGPVTLNQVGTLGGTGVVVGAVLQDGVIAPGAGIGTLTISNQVTDGVTAVYRMELGGTNAPTDYDQLVVSDVHTLQGTLEVVVTNGYVPASGDRFVILTNSGVGGLLFGTFTAVSAPALDPGLGWDVQYTGTESASLVVTGTVGAVLTPYEQWAQSIPNPALRGEQADADGDGYANLLEYSQGTDATNSADNAKLSLVRSNGQFLVLFNRVNAATDIVYEVEGAYLPTNNATWLGIATNVIGSWGGSTNVNDNNTAAVHRVLVTDLEIGTNRSLRLKVTRP
jgi:fibronectin-binding autotransporter adhesin